MDSLSILWAQWLVGTIPLAFPILGPWLGILIASGPKCATGLCPGQARVQPVSLPSQVALYQRAAGPLSGTSETEAMVRIQL